MKCRINIGPRLRDVAIGTLILIGMVSLVALGSDEIVVKILDMIGEIL